MKTLFEQVFDACGKDNDTKIDVLHDVVKYFENEPSTYWKASMVRFNLSFDEYPSVEFDDFVHWMENEVSHLQSELEFAQAVLKMLKS